MRNHRSVLALALALAVALGAGCNQVFDLKPTASIDAAYFDAAPPVCPAIGTPPSFGDNLHQILVQDCKDYTVSPTGRSDSGDIRSRWCRTQDSDRVRS